MSDEPIGFDHVAILVRDLPAARRYWTEVIGLPVAREPDLSPLGLDGVFLGTGRGQVELYTILDPDRLDAELGMEQESRLDHVALVADDLDGTIDRLKGTGVRFRHPGTMAPQEGPIEAGGVRHAWTAAPWGPGAHLQVSGT